MYTVDPALGTYATAGLSGTYIPEIWSGKLLEKFYAATVFAAISNTDYEGEIKAFGDKVIIRTVPAVTISDYKIGQSLTYERLQSDNVELLIDQGKSYSFVVNKVEEKQADIDYLDKWSEDASENMKVEIDTDILGSIYASAGTYNAGITAGKVSGGINLGVATTDGSTAIGMSTTTTVAKIVECGQVLSEQNRPETGRWMVLPAWTCTKIKTSELSEASYSGDGTSMKRNGRVGRIDHFEIFSSNNIAPITETSTKCYPAVFGHKSALTFASQLVENEMLPNPNDFGKLIRGLQVYGFKVVQEDSLGCLYCKPA